MQQYIGRRNGRLWVEHADPRTIITRELLDCIAAGPADGVTLTLAWNAKPGCCLYLGAALRIEAANQTLVYRITKCSHEHRGYIAEWPD